MQLVSSRWSPSDPTTQVKEESKQTSASVAPLQETDSSAADFDKSSPEEPIPLSDTETLENTQSSSVLPESAEQFPDTQFDFSPPQDLDNKDVDKVEESTTEVSLVQNQDLKQVEPIAEVFISARLLFLQFLPDHVPSSTKLPNLSTHHKNGSHYLNPTSPFHPS